MLSFTQSMDTNKCIVTRIHNDSIRNILTALKVTCAAPIHPSYPTPEPLATTDLFIIPIVLPFRVSCGWSHRVCILFRLVPPTPVICTRYSLMTFHGLIAHFFFCAEKYSIVWHSIVCCFWHLLIKLL